MSSKEVLTEETKELLYKYFDAANQLYGIIPLYKLLKIFNSHNQPITEEQFLEFADNIDLSSKHYDIIGADEMYDNISDVKPINRELVAEYLYMVDDDSYYELKEAQIGNTFYVPPKEKFLRYADELYFEKTLEFLSLRSFLRNLGYLSKEKADDIADEIQLISRINNDNDIEFMVDSAISMGVNLDNPSIREEFIILCMEVNANVRKHIYRGHTYKEIMCN